jgi:hypothetical protein
MESEFGATVLSCSESKYECSCERSWSISSMTILIRLSNSPRCGGAVQLSRFSASTSNWCARRLNRASR